MRLAPRGMRCSGAVALPALLALTWPAPAASVPEPVTPDTLDLPGSVARGKPPPETEPGLHRLDREALRRFASLEEALESLPGFRVRRQGGLGGYSEVRFRGAPGAAVDVYVDGIRLNHDGEPAPDLSRWPLLWFSSLEARTGFDPRGSGPGSLARIDLSTRSGGRGEAHARAGSFSTMEAAAAAQAGGDWTWTLGAQGQGSRNDHRFHSDNGTIHNTADDGLWRMDNNGYRSRGARAAARREAAAGRQSFSLLWLASRKEYPGLFPATAEASGTRNEWLGSWRLDRRAGTGDWGLGLQARRLEDAYRDPSQSLGYLSHESARGSFSVAADARARLPLGERAEAGADVRLSTESAAPTVTPFSHAHSSPSARRDAAEAGLTWRGRSAGGFSLAAELRPARVSFAADGLRGDDSGPAPPERSDHLPLALRAEGRWEGGGRSVALVLRREERAPSSGELLGDNLGIRSNLRLRPEETRALSLTHAAGGARARGQATLFWNDHSDPIRLGQYGASPFLRYTNRADYRAAGFEASGALDGARASLSASLTLQDTRIREGLHAGNRAAHQPPVQLHAEGFLKPRAGFLADPRVGLLLDYRAPWHPGDANIPAARREAEWELGLHAGARRGPLRLSADARNLFDRHGRDFAYSPRSGRSVSLGVSLSL